MKDCETCARLHICTKDKCDYINIDDAIKAYEDQESGTLERVVHCPDCRECIERGDHANCRGYLYCTSKCRLVTETDYCSWGEAK